MGSIGNKVEYPIQGVYTTKKGIDYHYYIHPDNTVEVYQTKVVPNKKGRAGYRTKDFYSNPTKELIQHLEDKYKLKGVR